MKAFLNSIPGMNILLIGIGVFIAVFILICYISFVLAIWEEEEAKRKRGERMTNRQKINAMSDEEFAEWLCKRMWDNFNMADPEDKKKYEQVLNFLRAEAGKGGK